MLAHLVEAAGCAIFAPGGEVPELHVQQFYQLAHGSDGVADVPRVDVAFGLLWQLAGNESRCLSGS